MATSKKSKVGFDKAVDRAVRQAQGGTRPTPRRKDGPSGRFYEVDGKEYPSVTHILKCIGKPALINWAANQERMMCIDVAANLYMQTVKLAPMSRPAFITTFQKWLGNDRKHKKELEKAGDIGSQIHALIEWNLRRELGQLVDQEPRVVDAAQWAFMAFQDWAARVKLKPIYIEQTVYSDKYEFAGTMDLLAEVDGVVSLIDFKSGKAIYGEAHLQSVAYQEAFIEMGHMPQPEQGIIVRLPKNENDPEFETVVVPDRKSLFPVFLAVRQVWEWWFAAEEAYRERYRQQQKAKREAEKGAVG